MFFDGMDPIDLHFIHDAIDKKKSSYERVE